MKRIGNNEFFKSARGAKTAATRRGYADGARVIETSAGYCLLASGEGSDDKSYPVLQKGQVVAELTANRWQDVPF